MPEEQEFCTSQSDGIVVSACPVLVDESANRFMWGYYLCIENNTDSKIQLLSKNWNISDDAGNFYNDSSAGFKGELPELEPGEYFEFTSEAPLKSLNAVFYGSCKILAKGQTKEIRIPTFSLSAPGLAPLRTIN